MRILRCIILAMSQKPAKMKAYDSFSEWKDDQSAEHQKLIGELQTLIHKTAPHLTTTVKWGQGSWTDEITPRLYIHTEPDHLQLGFYRGSELDDPNRVLSGNGKYVRFIKIQTVDDIDTESISALIKQASRDT